MLAGSVKFHLREKCLNRRYVVLTVRSVNRAFRKSLPVGNFHYEEPLKRRSFFQWLALLIGLLLIQPLLIHWLQTLPLSLPTISVRVILSQELYVHIFQR